MAILFGGNAGSGDLTGMVMGLGSGLFFGLYMMWLRRMKYADSVLLTFVHCGAVALIFAAVPGVWDVSGRDAALLALMAAVQFAVPYTLFARGVRTVASAEASLIALVEQGPVARIGAIEGHNRFFGLVIAVAYRIVLPSGYHPSIRSGAP